jgi:hypothetical protein
LDKKTKEEVLPPTDAWKTTALSGKQLKKAEVTTNPQTSEFKYLFNLMKKVPNSLKKSLEKMLENLWVFP